MYMYNEYSLTTIPGYTALYNDDAGFPDLKLLKNAWGWISEYVKGEASINIRKNIQKTLSQVWYPWLAWTDSAGRKSMLANDWSL